MLATLMTHLRENARTRRAPSALATTNTIICELRHAGRRPTMMQVQRLALIAHGWSLALADAPIFADRIVVYGDTAAVPEIHSSLHRHGSDEIDGFARHPDLPAFDHPEDTDPERLGIIREVVRSYGGFTAYRLGAILRRALPDRGNGDTITREELAAAFDAMARSVRPD